MSEIAANNKRIVKNTIMLYARMIVSTVVSLLTVRYTLQILGVENYGIYNVVGGVVGFMGIITGSMNSATQRYLAYELGRGDFYSFNKTFCR